MSNKVDIKLNNSGIQELLKSDGLAAICRQKAEEIASRAGDGFSVEERNYPKRKGYAVRPTTSEAYYRNLEENTLLKALGS